MLSASAVGSGTLWLRVETDADAREERHPAKRGPVYIGNQLDFLMHGLDVDARRPHFRRHRRGRGQISIRPPDSRWYRGPALSGSAHKKKLSGV